MIPLSRADNSLLGRWWWTVDRWTLAAVAALVFFGYVMMMAASPAVAAHIRVSRDMFLLKQVVFLCAAMAILFTVSLLSPRGARRVALVGCALALLLTAMTLVTGSEIKGARRWLSLPGMSMQPSEFLKPFFAVVAAWMIAQGKRENTLALRLAWPTLALGIAGLIAVLLTLQKDMGMLAVLMGVLVIQLFVSGVHYVLIGTAMAGLGAAGYLAYLSLDHVRRRVDKFLDPASGDTFQVDLAAKAFGSGGLLGRGPGEGRVKDYIPDSHADFVFAVAGEEFGLVVCMIIVLLFAFVALRGMLRMLAERDLYVVLAATGLAAGFGLQAFVNLASTLHLIPTKGMTLPFVSYGGSSALAVGLGVGLLLALTRRRLHGDLS
jgi:cell division protein FtsW